MKCCPEGRDQPSEKEGKEQESGDEKNDVKNQEIKSKKNVKLGAKREEKNAVKNERVVGSGGLSGVPNEDNMFCSTFKKS